MGCASSTTPMIATAGSEMLKSAKHVAEDATKSAEDAVQDVTQSLGKSLDTAKESVGTAVTGIAHDLGNAFKEKTEALDEAKNGLMEKLHLGTTSTVASEHKDTDATNESSEDDSKKTAAATKEADGEERTSRAPTPAAHDDADSLKTSTPEPEIEQALANCSEESPPTPKPTLAELEHLNAEAKPTVMTATTKTATAPTTATKTAAGAETTEESSVEKSTDSEQLRPGTTEWEKFADVLSHHRKYNPHEAWSRRGGGGHVKSNRIAPPPPVPIPNFGRPTAIVHRVRDDDSGLSDPNSYSSPLDSNPSSAVRTHRGRLPRGTIAASTRKLHRELTSLVGSEHPHMPHKSPAVGRKFDFNPSRMRIHTPEKIISLVQAKVGSPVTTRSLTRTRVSSPIKSRLQSRSRVGSPVTTRSRTRSSVNSPIKARSIARSQVDSTIKTTSQAQSHVGSLVQTESLTHSRDNSPVLAVETLSRSSRSSTNNSIVIKSSRTSPISRTPSKSSLFDAGGDNQNVISRLPSRSSTRIDLRSRSPGLGLFGTRSKSPSSLSLSPARALNTSAFLSSPRSSPFSIRKTYSEYSEIENRSAAFVADLSSVTESRNLLTPSPYKIRARCAVCYNKYAIK